LENKILRSISRRARKSWIGDNQWGGGVKRIDEDPLKVGFARSLCMFVKMIKYFLLKDGYRIEHLDPNGVVKFIVRSKLN